MRVAVQILTKDLFITLENFRISFSVRRDSDGTTPDNAEITIYNLSPRLSKSVANAEGKVTLLLDTTREFTGDIQEIQISREGTESKITITALDGGYILNKPVSISVKNGATVATLIKELNKQGIPITAPKEVLSKPLPLGLTHDGNITNLLDQISLLIEEGRYSFQDGIVQFWGKSGKQKIITLTSETGLISSPSRVRKQQKALPGLPLLPEGKLGWRVQMVLVPGIRPGDVVDLRSSTISGRFVVIESEQRGDTHTAEPFVSELMLSNE